MGHRGDSISESSANNKAFLRKDSEQYETLVKSAGQLEADLRANDPWDVQHASSFCNIGNICSQMGMHSDALAMYEWDLQITEHNLNSDDLRVIGSKYNSGLALCKLGRYAEALTLLEDVLRVRKAILGSEHVDVANALTCIGGIHSCKGRHAEALARYEKATSIRKAALGPDHATVALSLRNSSTTLACLGQTSFAIEHCEEAYAILLRQMGSDHRLTVEAKQLLADLTAGNPRAQVFTHSRFTPGLDLDLFLFLVNQQFEKFSSAACDPCNSLRVCADLAITTGHRRRRPQGDRSPPAPVHRGPAAPPRRGRPALRPGLAGLPSRRGGPPAQCRPVRVAGPASAEHPSASDGDSRFGRPRL